jgi:hypothetical protein
MRQFYGVFTQSMNRKHSRVGHLFQGCYKAILVDKDNYLLELCRYIVLNAVRACMVDSPDEWPWSSWHCTLSNTTSPSWLFSEALLLQFSGNRKDAIECYIEFVKNDAGKKIWDDLQHQVFLGNNYFVEKHQTMLVKLSGDLLEIPFKQRSITLLSLENYSVQSKDKYDVIFNAYLLGGYTQKKIGDYFGLYYSQISRIIQSKIQDLTPLCCIMFD